MPPIVAVIAAYNAQGTIARAVRSAVALRTVTRVLVIDDGSTDNTARLAADAGAHVLRQPNAGPAVARNRGLAAADADRAHALLLDADDEFLPAADEALLAALAPSPPTSPRAPAPAAVLGEFVEIDPATNLPTPRRGDLAAFLAGDAYRPAIMLYPDVPITASGMLIAAPTLAAGLRFDPSLHFFEDRDFVYRASRLGPIVAAAGSSGPAVRKFREPGQMTTNPARVRRYLADAVRLTHAHAADFDDEARAQMARCVAWTLKRACKVLPSVGQTLPADEWRAATDALATLGSRVNASTRKWRAAGPLLAPFARLLKPARPVP